MISFVYAQERSGGIGYQNDLPWHLPNDLKFFKKTTMGHTILMGRKTFESMNKRLLPGRKTVVLTSQLDYGSDIEGLLVLHSIEQVREMAKEIDLMVIGGANLFLKLLDDVDQIIRTVIDEDFPFDVQMPEINQDKWELVKQEQGLVDAKNKHPHRFEWWRPKER